ncbi:signal peptidase I [Klenkia soli]|uniref:Signal peptidase I n=1 Tax=Klenkia soli TaxID=1052260 RepID=A0A1H0IXU3_9ACTN|nr:signal peptidase I [Klenkia soli]SDO36183.1 signal peptidase I [Klenkia soli]
MSHRLRRTAVVVAQVLVVAAVVVVHLCGVRLVPVLTGSMTPYSPAGSLVVTVPVAGEDVAVGDVVAFRPPAPFEVVGGHPILHRVAGLTGAPGSPLMTTQGDANPTADPWQVSLAGADLGRSVLVIPWVGRLVAGGAGSTLASLAGGALLLGGLGALRRGRRESRSCPDCTPAAA